MQFAFEQWSELTQALARIDQAYQRYAEALIVLGERVAGLVDLDPPAPNLTIVETE